MANQVASAALGVGYWVLVARLYDAETVGRNAALIATLMFLSDGRPVRDEGRDHPLRRPRRRARPGARRAYLVVVACSVVAGRPGSGSPPPREPRKHREARTRSLARRQRRLHRALLRAGRRALRGAAHGARAGRERGLQRRQDRAPRDPREAAPSYGILLSWTLPMPIFIAWISWVIFRRVLRDHETSAEDELPSTGMLARWVVGDHVGALFTEAAARLLPLIVVHQLGDAQNAYFYQAWVIASTLPLLAGSGTTAFIVEAAEHPRSSERSPAGRSTTSPACCCPVAAVGLVAAPWVLHIFGGGLRGQGHRHPPLAAARDPARPADLVPRLCARHEPHQPDRRDAGDRVARDPRPRPRAGARPRDRGGQVSPGSRARRAAPSAALLWGRPVLLGTPRPADGRRRSGRPRSRSRRRTPRPMTERCPCPPAFPS